MSILVTCSTNSMSCDLQQPWPLLPGLEFHKATGNGQRMCCRVLVIVLFSWFLFIYFSHAWRFPHFCDFFRSAVIQSNCHSVRFSSMSSNCIGLEGRISFCRIAGPAPWNPQDIDCSWILFIGFGIGNKVNLPDARNTFSVTFGSESVVCEV